MRDLTGDHNPYGGGVHGGGNLFLLELGSVLSNKARGNQISGDVIQIENIRREGLVAQGDGGNRVNRRPVLVRLDREEVIGKHVQLNRGGHDDQANIALRVRLEVVTQEETQEVIVYPPLVNLIEDHVRNAVKVIRVVDEEPQQVSDSDINNPGIVGALVLVTDLVSHSPAQLFPSQLGNIGCQIDGGNSPWLGNVDNLVSPRKVGIQDDLRDPGAFLKDPNQTLECRKRKKGGGGMITPDPVSPRIHEI